MTVAEITKLWMIEKEKQVKISSFSAYMGLIDNHILPVFGSMEEVPEKDVQAWVYDKLNNNALSVRSVRDILICFKMILKFGSKHNFIKHEGFDIVFPTASRVRTKLETLSKSDYNKLTAYLFDNFSFLNVGLLISLYTGIRIGEVCAMKWNDIDMDKGLFTIEKTLQRIYIFDKEKQKKRTILVEDTPKTSNSYRDIPIQKDILRLFRSIKKIIKDENYVLTNTTKPTEPRTFRNHFYRILDKLGISHIKFHGMRHTFATKCIEGGADIKTTSVLLGHSNVSITLNTYVHPNEEQKRNIINKIFK